MQLKYVIIDMPLASLAPMVFREDIGHESAVLGLKREFVVSAGFVSVVPDLDNPGKIKASAYGYSVGLKLGSVPERDSTILTRMFNER